MINELLLTYEVIIKFLSANKNLRELIQKFNVILLINILMHLYLRKICVNSKF